MAGRNFFPQGFSFNFIFFASTEFDTQARLVYSEFVKRNGLSRVDSFLVAWREVIQIQGPFKTEEQKQAAITKLKDIEDFMVSKKHHNQKVKMNKWKKLLTVSIKVDFY